MSKDYNSKDFKNTTSNHENNSHDNKAKCVVENVLGHFENINEDKPHIIDINMKRPFTQLAATEESTKSGVEDFDDLQQEISREPLTISKIGYLILLMIILFVMFFMFSLLLRYTVGYGKEKLKDVKGGNEDIMTMKFYIKNKQC
ncbi:hypothetical protein AAEX28_06910 [Lentisphaerota bacterium WC36G]|nr:hypothetical protein LJT99_09775 [Lentisphaerae bacterium WC36]